MTGIIISVATIVPIAGSDPRGVKQTIASIASNIANSARLKVFCFVLLFAMIFLLTAALSMPRKLNIFFVNNKQTVEHDVLIRYYLRLTIGNDVGRDSARRYRRQIFVKLLTITVYHSVDHTGGS